VYEETQTGRPHDTSVQKATSDNENVDAVQRHAQDGCMDLIDVYRYIVDTVVDVVVQGAVLPLPHVGLQPETF